MVDVQGADQFLKLAKRMKEIADKELSKEFSKAITAATKPLVQDIRASARATLPARGGLAERVAKSAIRTQRRTSSRAYGVRVVAKNPYAIKALDEGRLRHPVFGTDRWVTQTIKPGWWTNPTQKAGPEMREAVLKAMSNIARKIGEPL